MKKLLQKLLGIHYEVMLVLIALGLAGASILIALDVIGVFNLTN